MFGRNLIIRLTELFGTPQEPILGDDEFIKIHDAEGEEIFIPIYRWRSNILPSKIEKEWNNPDALYELLLLATENKVYEEILDAAKHLVTIDPVKDRAYNILGLIYLHTNALTEQESTLKEGISSKPSDNK